MQTEKSTEIELFLNEISESPNPDYALAYPYGIAIAGAHFGDEGKGKFVDLMIRKLKDNGYKVINVRGQGGGNAGHTVIDAFTKNEYHFHYLPSGGLVSDLILLGGGMLLDPIRIIAEASVLPKKQQEKILVDGRATFCTLLERLMDGYYEIRKIENGATAVGTTGSGVGPAVAYRAFRTDIRFFEAKSYKNYEELLTRLYDIPDVPKYVWQEIEREHGTVENYAKKLYDAIQQLNIVQSMPIIQYTKDHRWALVLEVSQAFCLDSIYGNCGKYITSTHTTGVGALADAGLGVRDLTQGILLVCKAYASKVGLGPFVTKFCVEKGNMEEQVANFIYQENGEKGVTTGRVRSLGWFDCVAVRAAIQRNGSRNVAINCMDTIGMIPYHMSKICIAYKNKYTGKETVFWPDNQADYEPVYKNIVTDWNIKHFTDEKALPNGVWEYLANIEYYTGAKVKFIGTGGSEQDIVRIHEYGRKKIQDIVEILKKADGVTES